MKGIYLDNSCTSFPKAPNVAKAMYEYMQNGVSNINRSSYKRANAVEEIIYDLRYDLNEMFNGDDAKNVIFTKNITESLNIVMKGLLKKGDHVLVSSMEHNAIMRPLTQLMEVGITFDRVPCDSDGNYQIEKLEQMFKPNTRAIITAMGNNVCGAVYPMEEIGKIAKKHNVFLIVDSAQAAGVLDIDMKKMNIDVLCFTGHKSLLGPQGIGGFILREYMIDKITPIISGGTGSASDKETIPDYMPDKFEAGTMNVPNMIGLYEGIKFIKEVGIDNIRNRELELTKRFLSGLFLLENDKKIKIVGRKDINNRVGVVSIQTITKDLADVAFILDNKYSISVRAGLHCAPSTHKTLGTFPMGTIRFSFGYFNTEEDVDIALKALNEIL